jgi:hypothetical protein
MNFHIKNISDLQDEILKLKAIEDKQSIALKGRFNSPSAIFSSFISLLNSGNQHTDGAKHPGIFNQDFLGLLSRVVLPVTLNKTLFKRSNFLVKTLVGLVSQKASNYISGDAAGGIWSKVKSLFHAATKTSTKGSYKPATYTGPAKG